MNRRASSTRALRGRRAALIGVFLVVANTGMVTGVGAETKEPVRTDPVTPACPLVPIATSRATVADLAPETPVKDILNGDRPGQRGWMTWTGLVPEPVLAVSLTLPGDSGTYINAEDPADHLVSVGDWVPARPGIVTSRAVGKALDALVGHEIVVPVWDATRAQGKNAAYRVSGFARFSVTDYQLAKDNRIGARYLGPSDCAPPTQGPSAVAASASTPEDTAVSIPLTGRSGLPGMLTFVVAQPQHGTVVIEGDPTCTTVAAPGAGAGAGAAPAAPAAAGPAAAAIAAAAAECSVTAVYTPSPDFNGPDEFTFTVADAATTSPPASVAMIVSPVNDPPVTGADQAAGREDTTLEIPVATVLSNDVPGPADEATQVLTVTAVKTDGPSHGTATLAGGKITYTPDPGYSGPATITYSVCDDGKTADQPDPRCTDGTIEIQVGENSAPAVTNQEATTPEDTALAVVLGGTDQDGDTLSFAVTGQPAHGTLSGTAPNLTYTPAPDFNGDDSFTFTASDAHLASEPARVDIAVTEVNDKPKAEPDQFAVGNSGPNEIPAVTIIHNDVPGPANESGQPLTVSSVTATAETHGTVTVANGKITYVADAGYEGPASFHYTLCDEGTTNGQPDPLCITDGSVSLAVTGPNSPPTADPQELTTAEDEPLPVLLAGDDPDGDPLAYSIVDPAAHGGVSGIAPGLDYTPAKDFNGVDAMSFVTNDGRVNSDPATVALRITEVNDPPVLGPDPVTVGGAGTLPPPPVRPVCGEPCGVIYGDPHMTTFDFAHYDFQAKGEFIAVKSTTDDFEIQVRTAPYEPSRLVTMAMAVAMRIGGHRVALYRTETGVDTRVDGAPFTVTSDPQTLPGGGTIGTYGSTYQTFVRWPDGSVAILDAIGLYPTSRRFTVRLGLPASRLTHVVGLLGNADAVKENDLVTRGGLPIAYPPTFAALYPAYADSWRISQAESLFDYGAGQTTETFTDRTFPDEPVTPAGFPPDVRAAAAAQCGLFGVTVPEVLDACIVDLGLTGDAEFASSAAAAQQTSYGIPDNTGTTSIGAATTVTIATPGETAARSFTATAGQRVTLSLTDNTIPGVDVVVRGPGGGVLASVFVSASSGFHDTFTLPVAGTYTVTVDPRDQGTGSLTFELDAVPDDSTGQTAIGVATTVTIATPGQNAVRSFTATAGQRVTLSVTANTIPGVNLVVRQLGGGVAGSLFLSAATGFHDAFTLPAGGTYTITVDPTDDNTGALTFTLGSVPEDSAGQTSIGVPTTVTISTAGQDAVRSFDATAGQKLTLTVSGNTIPGVNLVIRQPNNTLVGNLFLSGAASFLDTFTLPVSGTYTITIDPSGQNTGTLTFTLASVPDNTGTTAIGTPTGVTIGTVGENAVRSFDATAGQKLTLTVSGNTIPGVNLVIRQPNNTLVGNLFLSGAASFLDTFTLPVSGTYTITIDPSGQNTGTLTFTLASVPDNTGTTAIGTPTGVTIGTVGENAVRSFDATAGQKLTLTVSGNTIPGVNLVIRQPNNTLVGNLFLSGAASFLDTFTLPVSGTYTITIDPSGQNTGTLTFTLASVPDNTGTTAIGTPTGVTIGTVGENAVRSFDATAGQKLTLTVSGNTIPGVNLVIRQPNNTLVGNLFLSGAASFLDTFTLPVSGTYTITIDPSGQNTGTLTFTLASVPDNTGTTAIGTPTGVTIGTVGENAVRSFDATAGQKLTLTVSGNTIPGVNLVIRQPNNTLVGNLFLSGAASFLDTFTLPVSGTYTITIDPSGQNTGSLTFTLNNAPVAAANVGPAVGHADVAVLASAAGGRAKAARSGAVPDRESDVSAHVAAHTVPLVAAAAAPVSLTIQVSTLLANDRPGPANESDQTLTVTSVRTDASSHGTAVLADDAITFTADGGYVGPASFFYTACDNGTTDGQPDPRCSEGTINVKVTANHPPTVVGLHLETAEDSTLPVVLSGVDPDGDAVVFTIASEPAHGTLTGTAPNLTYRPAPDFHGKDSFAVSANDTHDASPPAVVEITVTEANDRPTAQPDSVTAGAGRTVTVAANELAANDAAGPFDEVIQTLTVTAVAATSDTHGTVTLSNGTVVYTPDAGFTGIAKMNYTVCDDGTSAGQPDPKCAEGVLTIVANRAPTAADVTAGTARNTAVTIDLDASDPEDDPLIFAIVAAPAHGALTGTGASRTYTPEAGFSGSDSFSYTAADATSTSAPATVSIVVTETPPPTVAPDVVATTTDQPVVIDVLANDTAGAGTLDAATLAIVTAPTNGTAVVENGAIRYTPAPGVTPEDRFTYRVCDTFGGCGQAAVSISVVAPNRPPVAKPDTYEIATGTTLHPAAPGVLANDSDPDPGDRMQARLVRGVTNGNLLLNSTGEFTYTPHGPGIDTFVYHVLDKAGLDSGEVTVTIVVTGPTGPPTVGNDFYDVQQGRELVVAAPGILDDDFSPNPRLTLTALLQDDVAKGTLLLHPDGSFVYTPESGFAGLDQFSYLVRDSEGRVSQEAHVGIRVAAGGPATATVGATSPAAGARITGPTHCTATLVPPAGETVTSWTVSYRRPGDSTLVQLATGSGTSVACEFDPTTIRNGTYAIVIRAETSGGGILVSETPVSVEGAYKPGRYTTTYRDVAIDSADIPIDLFRTYDSADKTVGDFGVGWSLKLAQFRIDTNGPLGGGGWSPYQCGSFPFLATCYQTSKPHFVTVTWPDGHLERFKFVPDQGSSLVPTITTAGFKAEPGTTSTLAALDNGLILVGSDFFLGNFFFADGIYDPIRFVLTDKSGVKYTLDRRGGVLAIVDRNGNRVDIGAGGIDSSSGPSMTFTRDAANRITRIVAPGGNIDYRYSAAGDLVGVTYPDGTTQAFTYDAAHDLLTTAGAGQVVNSIHYDASGRVTSITDGSGATLAVDSDVAGHQQVSVDATGRLTTVTTYDDRGRVIRETQTGGGKTITTKATFDNLGRQLSSTDGLGHTSSKTYDQAGNVLTETDANGHTTKTTYNAFGQPLTVTDPTGKVATNTYDPRGNLITAVAPDGGTTTFTYDSTGSKTSEKDPAGRVTTYTYDAFHQPASRTDAAGRTTLQHADPASGRVTSVTDPNGSVTSLSYDENGNLRRVTAANGHTQTFGYDGFGRVSSFTDALGATVRRTYDRAGNMASITDRNGAVISYDYDATGRITSKSVPGTGTTTYTYDAFGRMTAASNPTAELTFTYDAAGHVLTAKTTGASGVSLPTATISYAYDPAGFRTSMTGPGGTTAYTYDDAQRLASVTDAAGGTFGFGYDPNGRLTSLTRPNGVDDAITYEINGELTELRSHLGATSVGESTYGYDLAGRRTSLTNGTGTMSFGYDLASRLVSATYPAGMGVPAQSFGYDGVGNRTSTESSPAGSFTYDAGDRLVADPTSDFTYDNEGNTLSRKVRATGATTSYEWSAEHRLQKITYPGGSTTTFKYDPFGRRVEIREAATTTRYLFDDEGITAQYDGTNSVLATFTGDGSTPTTHLELTSGGQRYFPLVDALSSTTALTTLGGAPANTYTYTAFGSSTQTGSVSNPFTFTGQLAHVPSGLVLFPERAYDPALGRFLTQDPIFSVNPYPYVDNNPVNLVDPNGTTIGGCIRGAILGAALIVGAANSNPAGSEQLKDIAQCAVEYLDAVAKRKELEEAQAAVRAQLAAEH